VDNGGPLTPAAVASNNVVEVPVEVVPAASAVVTQPVVDLGLAQVTGIDDFKGGWSADESVDGLYGSSMHRVLASSTRLSTARMYGRIWDK
jgi:hypothetical protein